MKRTFAFLAAGVLVSALAACSSSTPPPTLTIGTGTKTMPAPAVAKDVAGYPAPQGRYLLEVTVTLANPADGAAAVSGWWYNYALVTAGKLVLSPSTLSDLVGTPCSADTNVAAGGSFQCTLVFDVPCGDTAVALAYQGAAVAAPILGAPTVSMADCSATTGAGGASGTGGSVAGAGGSPAGTGGADAG